MADFEGFQASFELDYKFVILNSLVLNQFFVQFTNLNFKFGCRSFFHPKMNFKGEERLNYTFLE